ncbi:uncharacterized protein LOC105389738 [Plutella xylostella]|uniref:uncharacterized protein LOC105389738 n=1 Tax=Plutella xylostella TaxID=51655 RepID=UPI002032213A|nr:uncharacterized protein LOC105389738 [Plutella xylostella]
MNKYRKNSILCGEVDYHCLLCAETLLHEADVERHIRWENHRRALKNNTYVTKFKNDCIIKIGSHYYCELCNIITPTALKTNLHVKDEAHLRNKQNPETTYTKPSLVKRDTSGIIAINNMVVTEREWNGIIDNQCLLCDVDVESVETHMKSGSHIISLIQTKVEVKDADKFFRKIGADIFFCFACKEPIPLATFDQHWESKEHIDNKKNVKIYKGASSSQGQSTFSAEFKNNMKKMFSSSDPSVIANADIAAKMDEFKKENIDINMNRSKAVCKVCNFSPEFSVKAITEHIKMHKKAETNSPGFQLDADAESDYDNEDDDDDDYEDCSTDSAESDEDDEVIKQLLAFRLMSIEAVDHGLRRAELAKFGKQHFIKLISGGSKGHCTLCDTYISAHIKNFHQHVKGAKHIENLALKGGRGGGGDGPKGPPEYETKPLREYLRNIFFVKQMDDFWINRRICIDKHSFVGVRHVDKMARIKCFLCNDLYPADKDQEHCQTIEHKKKLFATKVITSLKKGEFCRQFTPTKLHCAFCNEVFPSYPVLLQHLRTPEHINWKRQQKMVADMTDDMYSMHMPDTNTAEADIMWMELTGNKLL